MEWVLRERGSGTRAVFEDALAQSGLDPHALRIALELPSNESVRAAVEAGLGAAVISASVAAPSLEAGLLEQVSFHLPEREFYVLIHRDRHPSRAAREFLATLTSPRVSKRSETRGL
jgi:DNA-binding transcriptional LysR family regulator